MAPSPYVDYLTPILILVGCLHQYLGLQVVGGVCIAGSALYQNTCYISDDQPWHKCLEGFAMFRYPYEEGGKLCMIPSQCDYLNPSDRTPER